jgi:hypothetical protein
MINAATPRAMPNIETPEMKEMKVFFREPRLARVYRQPKRHSKGIEDILIILLCTIVSSFTIAQ